MQLKETRSVRSQVFYFYAEGICPCISRFKNLQEDPEHWQGLHPPRLKGLAWQTVLTTCPVSKPHWKERNWRNWWISRKCWLVWVRFWHRYITWNWWFSILGRRSIINFNTKRPHTKQRFCWRHNIHCSWGPFFLDHRFFVSCFFWVYSIFTPVSAHVFVRMEGGL